MMPKRRLRLRVDEAAANKGIPQRLKPHCKMSGSGTATSRVLKQGEFFITLKTFWGGGFFVTLNSASNFQKQSEI